MFHIVVTNSFDLNRLLFESSSLIFEYNSMNLICVPYLFDLFLNHRLHTIMQSAARIFAKLFNTVEE